MTVLEKIRSLDRPELAVFLTNLSWMAYSDGAGSGYDDDIDLLSVDVCLCLFEKEWNEFYQRKFLE